MSSSCRILEPLVLEANAIFEASLAKNTWKSYENGLSAFNEFRTLNALAPLWPPPIWHIANFIAYLSKMSYSPSTAKLYISSLSFVLKREGLQDTTQNFIIKQMLKGMTTLYGTPDIRLPISIEMMNKFPVALSHVCLNRYEATMYLAAFYLAFTALLRVSEFTCSTKAESYKIVNFSDLVLDENDKSIRVTIPYSKTDQLGRTCILHICQKDGMSTEAFISLKQYLAVRPKFDGPLFCHLNKLYISRNQFVSVLHSTLRFLGYTVDKFNTHSFRIGGCTHLAQLGFSDDEIKRRGRWLSNSYQRYIRM